MHLALAYMQTYITGLLGLVFEELLVRAFYFPWSAAATDSWCVIFALKLQTACAGFAGRPHREITNRGKATLNPKQE